MDSLNYNQGHKLNGTDTVACLPSASQLYVNLVSFRQEKLHLYFCHPVQVAVVK